MFLIQEDGHALIIIEKIICFEASLALELSCLIYSKYLFTLARTFFCAMANLIGRTLSSVSTLIFRLVRNLAITCFFTFWTKANYKGLTHKICTVNCYLSLIITTPKCILIHYGFH
jgi:hypothetical protein